MKLFTRNAKLALSQRIDNPAKDRASQQITLHNEQSRRVWHSETTRGAAMRAVRSHHHQGECPCCEKPLLPRSLDGTAAEICPDCGGVWLTRGAISVLVRRGSSALNSLAQEMGLPLGNVALAAASRSHLVCPVCDEAMEDGPYSYNLAARVDQCSQCCGVWVGAGELASIISHFTSSREAGRTS